MCKSVIYSVNAIDQVLAVGDVISFGEVIRKNGKDLKMEGGNLVIEGIGYYNVNTNFTLNATTAGTGVVTLYQNGVAIPGANSSFVALAAGVYSLTIPAIVRSKCCYDDTITAVLSGIGATITNAAIVAETAE